MGTGVHTEEDCRPEDESMVEDVAKEGKIFPRFKKITDAKIVAELQSIKEEMYGRVDDK